MLTKQLEKFALLYQNAVENDITVGEFVQQLKDAKIKYAIGIFEPIKEDMKFIDCLEWLKKIKYYNNEQS